MTKLELIELRKKGNIEESISLVNYYTKDENGVSKINYQLVENLLIEYILYGKYNHAFYAGM